MSDDRIGNVMATGSSPGPGRRRTGATRHRCAPNRSAAGAAGRSIPPTVSPTPLTAPSMSPASTRFHSPSSDATQLNRLHDGGVVQLVDVVLVQQQRPQAVRARPRRDRRARGFMRKKEQRDADAADRERPTTLPSACNSVPASPLSSPDGRARPRARPCHRASPLTVKLGARYASSRFAPPMACGTPT